ncbi:Glycoside hydrolase family 5 protein [Mycena venus]|uniref:Glycoside hydrolase family 5 protein n=1 Tax=Mycena venus TaxID=2733690 RepID=A0A8H7CGV7_9AGAR|nr:Glycoside hydrolase family 5 protein [Mycena venus]
MLPKAFLLASSGSALATVMEFGQRGGTPRIRNKYTGDTVYAAGLVYTVLNNFFFQCLKGTSMTTVSSSSTTTVSTSKSTTTTTSTASGPAPTGFVTTIGTKFTLNGARYTVVGCDPSFIETWVQLVTAMYSRSNAYWPVLLGYSADDIDRAFADIARLTGIRVIIALTNNWFDFGGMDVYTAQLLGSGQRVLHQSHRYWARSALTLRTFHMYSDSWSESANDVAWGSQWINDHAAVMTAQNKSVITEEFGLTTSARNTSYATWYSTVFSSGLTGDLVWCVVMN